jgi:hypothetical protein
MVPSAASSAADADAAGRAPASNLARCDGARGAMPGGRPARPRGPVCKERPQPARAQSVTAAPHLRRQGRGLVPPGAWAWIRFLGQRSRRPARLSPSGAALPLGPSGAALPLGPSGAALPLGPSGAALLLAAVASGAASQLTRHSDMTPMSAIAARQERDLEPAAQGTRTQVRQQALMGAAG